MVSPQEWLMLIDLVEIALSMRGGHEDVITGER